jgi:hypothetical protein
MLQVLQILTVFLFAIAMALALAHALELPGKLRLAKEQYLAVQPIYYPGFTIGGAAEPLGLLMTLTLLFWMPRGSAAFWLTIGAFVSLLAMHANYWLLTHSVNNSGSRMSSSREPAPVSFRLIRSNGPAIPPAPIGRCTATGGNILMWRGQPSA